MYSSHVPEISSSILSGSVIRISALVSGFAEMLVGEVEEDLPVLFGHRMSAGPDVISERAVNRLSYFRRLVGVQPLGAQQPINRIGRLQHFKLSLGICPGVFGGVRQEHRTRGAERNQAMLIEGQLVRLFVEVLEHGVEPVREMVVDLFDGLADFAAAGRGAAATGLQRYRQ